ncbi:hypothetical protein [Pseudoalteromonas sp. SR43-2]|uniref:hypothetical protein n=1 Tax=Pseudoalteromonas sp. SR43-2 TaxID=2760944 RepID=UPI0015FBF0D4|nr:hypothetical protein [Pseudoalteromonas sp. SR43-2]MBB1378404.1 hypothetical protein [Pseudoalteromonas sp. SR43-2]
MKVAIFKSNNFEIIINTNDPQFYLQNNKMIDALKEIYSGFDDLLNLNTFINKHRKSRISKDLVKLVDLINKRDPSWHPLCGSLYFILTSMQMLQESNTLAYRGFLKDIKKQSTSQSWKGLQFEIVTARGLSLKSISFTKSESPDFTVDFEGEDIFIECGSARVDTDKSKPLEYKIESAINKKNKKPYANSNTCLFLDITNIAHHDISNERFSYFDSLCKNIENKNEIKFGAILLLITFSEKNGYGEGYKTLKSVNCSKALNEFLDLHYPTGNFPLEKSYKVPPSI